MQGEGNESEEGIVCEYLLDYNAVGCYIILLRALNKVILGEVIFVIKLALTLGHKSWVLVLKEITKRSHCDHHITTYLLSVIFSIYNHIKC